MKNGALNLKFSFFIIDLKKKIAFSISDTEKEPPKNNI